MKREYYLGLAAQGLRIPVGADLVVHEKPDPHAVMLDGRCLGEAIAEAAYRYHTPLAVPLMDLTVEKAVLLEALEIPSDAAAAYHLTAPLTPEQLAAVDAVLRHPANPRWAANLGAIRHIAENRTDLVPVGMCIGPFSLMTKLIADPITAVYLAGTGLTGADDAEVRLVETTVEAGVRVITASARAQAAAGARLMFVCEPAANTVYLSPLQVAAENDAGDVFDRFVMEPNRRLKAVLDASGVDLLLHDCGELQPAYIRRLASLHPVILSLGSPVDLPAAAALVPKDVVLFGNLPSKKFYSDAEITVQQVREMAAELAARMRETGHPFILGTECDVLSVPGHEETIREKVEAMLAA